MDKSSWILYFISKSLKSIKLLKGDQNNEKQKDISKNTKATARKFTRGAFTYYLLQYNGLNKLTPFRADCLKEEEKKTIKKLQNININRKKLFISRRQEVPHSLLDA